MSNSESPLQRSIPSVIEYPADLPVAAHRDAIAMAISQHQVVIVAGETGSGKTTQLPKICLELGRGRELRIGHTQPRRIAARNVAQRISDEMGQPLGAIVGYQVRFTDQVSDASAVKVMTDGILLSELSRDKDLAAYDTLIIDEAHERSLNIDFILGYLKQLLPRRPDLKVVITSATIDVDRFSRHFDDAPVITVEGRTYPVQVEYLGDVEDRDIGVQEQIIGLLAEIDAGVWGARGDVLVFLPGEREIRELAKQLKGEERFQTLPLYARLSQREQQRVFSGGGRGMRVVLATNVAETSITVPGIRYVIDPGEARISRYSVRSKLQRLPVEKISQASANQRMGRCGRVGSGVCLRLYSEQDFLSRPEFTMPEILRTNLAAVILRMLELGLGDVGRFPFIDMPEPKMVRDGYRLLEELGAVSRRGRLTAVGRRMARLPIDPKLSRMLLSAAESNCLAEVLVIVSGLSVQDPRERPADKQTQSDQAHARFRHERSDFLSWLQLWQYYEAQRQTLSQSQLRKLCSREFLSFMRMREWRETHAQLVIACRQMGLKPRPLTEAIDEIYSAIHQSLLAGLLSNVAQHDEAKEYQATRNRKIQIFPGSGQYRKPPKWIVAAEIVETTQVFARQCAAIEPEWLLRINAAVLKRQHYEPSWQMRSGRVMARERVLLFGLVIKEGYRVDFGAIDPSTAREIFIRDALVAGQYKSPPNFLKKNLALIRSVQELESRIRRRDLLIEEEHLAAFYRERLPAECFSKATLEKALRSQSALAGELLLAREQILTRDPGGEIEAQFPKQLSWEGIDYQLRYRFEPGGGHDGVSVTVPRAILNRCPRYRFEYLVPGLLREKCIQLIKGLPKGLRKQLVPVPDVVDAVLAEVVPSEQSLTATLSRILKIQRRVTIADADWNESALEDFYRMNIVVVDDAGKTLAESREMSELVSLFRDGASPEPDTEDGVERKQVARWDFGDLPQQHRRRVAGMEVVSYPALVQENHGIAIKSLDYAADAEVAHRRGAAALLMKTQASSAKYIRKQLLSDNAATLALAGANLSRSALVEALMTSSVLRLLDGAPLPRSEDDFQQWTARLAGRWTPEVTEMERIMLSALDHLAQTHSALVKLNSGTFDVARQDIQHHISTLFSAETLVDAPANWFQQLPRFAKASRHRAERLSGQGQKDEKAMVQLAPHCERLEALVQRYPGVVSLSEPVLLYRWMLEEFRVSLFAQQLGTRLPVSNKRLDEQWIHVERWVDDNPR